MFHNPEVFKLKEKKYVAEELLGKGGFGIVYKVRRDDRPGSVYALKKIQVENQEAVKMVQKEINILTECNHDHIVRLCGFSVSQISRSTFVLILMEYCKGGNLNSRLARLSYRDTNLRWMRELADAISYLHSKDIVHRDLKPENVLLTGNESTRSEEALVSYLTTVYMASELGTPFWMAPEVLDGHYTESADIFSLGTIFYAILTHTRFVSTSGKKYYGAFVNVNGQKIGLGMAMRGNRNVMVPLDRVSKSKRELILGILDYNQKNRPNAREVLEDVESIRSYIRLKPTQQSTEAQTSCCWS